MEVRWFRFTINDDRFDVLKTCLFQGPCDFCLRESQPRVGIKIAGFIKTVLEEIEDEGETESG